jgi:hypothetical protein
MIRIASLGLVSALLGLIILAAFPFILTTIYLCSIFLFIGSITGLAYALQPNLEVRDGVSTVILGVGGVEYFAATALILKAYEDLRAFNQVNLFFTAFLVAIMFFAPSLLTVSIVWIRKKRQKQS